MYSFTLIGRPRTLPLTPSPLGMRRSAATAAPNFADPPARQLGGGRGAVAPRPDPRSAGRAMVGGWQSTAARRAAPVSSSPLAAAGPTGRPQPWWMPRLEAERAYWGSRPFQMGSSGT